MRLRFAAAMLMAAAWPAALAAQAPLPALASRDGRHALMVDGAPYLMLGVQANNSTNYPAMLPKLWPMVARLHANIVEIPVAWEQIEPEEGRFDFSYLDTLLPQARERGVRLVLLWFGTWKNTSPGYVPAWVKTDNARFPRMRTPDGKAHYALSPHGANTLAADRTAFVALMRYLREKDPQHTVIMVQPENEVGVYQQSRDYSPEANRLFAQAIPAELAKRTGKSGSWAQAFGKAADTYFNAWYTARYIEQIAAAGRREKDLPMYVNAAVGDPFGVPALSGGASGGPDWAVIDVWKVAAPHIDVLAPDLYGRDPRGYVKFLDHYARPDNALMVPETGNAADFARFLWPALGKGAIGWAPFGMDDTGYANYPLGAKVLDAATLDAFASKYALLAPQARGWARLAYAHPTWGSTKGLDPAQQRQVMGRWQVDAIYDEWQFGDRDAPWLKSDPVPTAGQPVGGAAVIQIAPDQFLAVGSDVRLKFALARAQGSEQAVALRVEEGSIDDTGRFTPIRVWNGDQTDYGLNFTQPTMLRITMGTFRG
ncbi:DUF5597 domain-containing protein [Sphingomonas silueang]|uniref:DUF5597 domain-containing protein n=1 Tax=Sphingomonas silueang TaxID=3156617 RepID=UPI0032B5EBE9